MSDHRERAEKLGIFVEETVGDALTVTTILLIEAAFAEIEGEALERAEQEIWKKKMSQYGYAEAIRALKERP